jgi:TatD DNase family protein
VELSLLFSTVAFYKEDFMLFDTHVHLNADQFEDDVEEVISRAQEAGVENMVVVGFDEKTIKKKQ